MKRTLLSLLLVTSIQCLIAQNKYTLDSTELTSRVVKDSLDIPWEIIWGPDDFIWTTERFGRVSRIDPVSGKQHVLLDISSQVYERSEAGLLGMVLHPEFDKNPHVFIAYTYQSGSNIRERMVKYNYDGSKLTPLDTLIEDIKGNTTHIGCRLFILPDKTMLMSTGDAQDRPLSQNKSSVVGKILRLNLDGSIPSDNPDPRSYVWSYGHRNAQGIWRAPNGKIYSSEHGPTTDDELNILEADRNYGWPTVSGMCDTPPEQAFCNSNNVVEPLVIWTPTIAPSDIIWYDHPAIPEFKDKLLMTVLKDKSLIAFGFNTTGDSVISQKKYLKNELNRLRDICISPDGKIYLATNGSSWSNTRPFTHTIVELSNEAYIANSILGLSSTPSIKIGPNPLREGQPLNFMVQEGVTGDFQLFDLMGRPVLKQKVEGGVNSIDLKTTEGIYLWKVVFDNGTLAEGKLVVN
ncbi:MAG: glucose dehydrogenase [Crocinitomicaceae bacterium]|nr:glucose dehydrogenase [Crocinitomicaceae bacterium]|tara:strand:+ start:1820 stop:3205 length:1386 start_codon:yes stop_codon:yes gene_type:complete